MKKISLAMLWKRESNKTDKVEMFAASELKKYLSQIMDQEIPVRNEQLLDTPIIYISAQNKGVAKDIRKIIATTLCNLHPDGYILRREKNGIIIAARTSRGLLYGVYGFLKHLGARWYFPGSFGEFMPSLREVQIGAIDVVSTPIVNQRGVLINGDNTLFKEWIDFLPKVGLNAIGLIHQEGIHRLPELARGRGLHLRIRRHFFPRQFCSADERKLKWEETLLKSYLMSVSPEIHSVHLRPADNWGMPCTCPVDRQFSIPDQVMRFTNRMAKVAREIRPQLEFPYVAYLSTWCPPPKVPPSEGVPLSLACIHRCFNHAINDPNCFVNASYRYKQPINKCKYGLRPIIEEHLKRFDVSTTFVVDYWLDASIFGRGRLRYWKGRLPQIGGIMQRDIQYYHNSGITSIWTFVVHVNREYLTQFTSPLLFQYGELLWNPETDLRAGLKDFCRHYYGDEALSDVFSLDEPSDPQDITPQIYTEQINRVSKLLRITDEVAKEERNDMIRGKLIRLVTEQKHYIKVMRKYRSSGNTIFSKGL